MIQFAQIMTKLEFGIAHTADQALTRLPTRSHPLYSEDEIIEHITHFGEKIIELQVLQAMDPDAFQELSLEERLIPLLAPDVHFIERVSFRRKEPEIAIAQWEFIRPESEWGLVLPSGDNQYRWWKITELTPELGINGSKLVSVESNTQFFPDRVLNRSNEQSEFEVGILKHQELDSLVDEITRLGR